MQSGKTMDVEVDRLSSLPDDLIYKILSEVDILYCVRLSVLSSRWRFIWTSLPNLNFICHDAYVSSSSRYYEFVNNVLSVRNNKIDVSSVSVNLYDPELLSVKRILEYAFSHNVQQLTIGRDFEIPTSLLSSKSLKHLTIIGSGTTIYGRSHSLWDLPALTTLHINQVSLFRFSSILAMCHNLKNLTLERCCVFKQRKAYDGFTINEDSDGFTINNSRLLSLTLKKVYWDVAFLLVDTPQLKNLILVDTPQQEKERSRGIISELSGVTISARDLTYLRIKGSYFPELFLDGFPSLEKVDLCISSPQDTDVHKIFDLFQRLQSVKYLALSLEIVELLSTSDEVTSFPSLKSLKIYPSLNTQTSGDLETYPLGNGLYIFRTEPDQEQEAMKIKLSAEVTKYLLDSSSNATFTMVSHEEARAIKLTKAAHSLMAALWKILEEVEANVEWKKTFDDSRPEYIQMNIWPRGDTEVIFRTLQNIKLLLTNVPASKRVQTQACFSRLSEKTKTVVNKIVVDMKNQCDIRQRMFSGYLDEIFLSS